MALDMAVDDTDRNRIQLAIQQAYNDFLDDTNKDGVYIERIKEMIKKKKVRVIVNINDLRHKNEERCIGLLENGFDEIPLFHRALREVVATIDPEYAKEHEEFFIGLEGSFGSKHVTPRSLSARFLGNVICLEGIVTKCSMIRPKVVRSVHYCPATKKTIERRYGDVSAFDTMPSVNLYPTKDDNDNPLETEYGLSKYRDHQTITIQEMPEKAPTGQLPRAVDIVLDNDLVDTCKPGDRILVVGVFRCLPGKQGGYTTGVFKGIILANHVLLMTKDANLHITKEDVKECKRFSRTANPFNTLARSLAPSIHGHDFIKKAVLCLLLGGVEKVLANGTRLRGDINVLLIGDPSVAKSQMLRYVGNVAPRVVLTTGRGSSGVGLTAAVTTDGETGERRLEAGAMVLADRGIVCIDEFDKMSDADRTSIHEVMEQGRVTISKAGIHARLNSRTSVLAAANPVYGRYDEYKSPMDNIGLQDSLLSRFDLLFIVLDVAKPELDRSVAEHVLRMHRYRNAGEQEGAPTPLFQGDMLLSTMSLEDEHPEEERTPTFEKHDPLLHGTNVQTRQSKILSMEFIKKYLHIAKCIKPALTSEASRVIAEEYTRLRSFNADAQDTHLARTQPITARSLETLIRLSTAHARARMSKQVTKEDANAAIELVQFAYFKRVLEREKKKRRRGQRNGDGDTDEEDGGEGHEDEGDEDDEGEAQPQPGTSGQVNGNVNGNGVSSPKRPRVNDVNGHGSKQSETMAEEMEKQVAEVAAMIEEPMDQEQAAAISDERYARFSSTVATYFHMERTDSLSHNQVVEWYTMEERGYTHSEVTAGLNRLETEGHIMQTEGFVYLI